MTVIFDTLEYVKGAEQIGIKREHAEYQAKKMSSLINDTLATKDDLRELKYQMIIWLGSMMVVCTATTISVLGFLLHS